MLLTIRDAVIVGDGISGRIALWNCAAQRVFGYSAEEVLGLPIEMLFPDQVREQYRAALADYVRGGGAEWDRSGTFQELPALHRSGAEITIEFSLSPLNAPGGHVYLLAIVRNVTERKRIQAERDALLIRDQEVAHQMAVLKADFTAMIAHELGTPLAAVNALVDLLEHNKLSAAGRQHVLATIRTETQLLQRLVADMRFTGTFDRDDFVIEPQRVAVETLLGEAAASAQGQLREYHFHAELAPDSWVWADPDRIGQVLRNLLGNVAKHTPPGTEVNLRAITANGRVRFEVEDHGRGIHPDDMERVFRKFGRGRDLTGIRPPGVGLGLYLSWRIIKAHGGELAVQSQVGSGSTFAFDLEEMPSHG
jgi:PAS domain S-box-containing protein